MSWAQDLLSVLIGSFGDFAETFITTAFNVFVVPVWVVFAGFFGLTPNV
ncbi:MAG: hypothetical protein JXQ75_22470 [Phycisphaerae bacterium]|nr:hypothetical protein [Phycisphaerae bacterium]